VNGFRIVAAGDSAIIVEFDNRIDPVVHDRVLRLAAAIEGAALRGVRDVVPTYRSVGIHFDPLRTDYDGLLASVGASIKNAVEREGDGQAQSGTVQPPPPVRVPVCYTREFGPDLGDVAAFGSVSDEEVARLHWSRTYRVFMLGFIAGFAYMGTVDARIAAPRLAVPRVRVPAGSVGIADVQTGIYPVSSPGGWRIIGRTPVKPFDLAREEPFLFRAGDAVEFYPIEPAEYARLERAR
jgi:inhibitor of KinA